MKDTPTGIEREIAAEKAAALGRSGRKLKAALDKLQRASPEERQKLVELAGDALWSYLVQREALGLIGDDYIKKEYKVPAEVWRQMLPRPRS